VYDYKANRRNRAIQFTEYKKTLLCMDCGIRDHRVLQFHHKDPDSIKKLPNGKKVRVPHMVRTSSWKTLLKYMSQCDVLCANCHIIRHYTE
jgi:hypothetical protein